jgi:hypothetical protein
MAAATRYLVKGQNKLVVNVTGAFSVGDETDTVIIDLSTLAGPENGVAPTAVRIDEITWSLNGGWDYVLLEWDHTADDVVDYFHGQGYMDYRPYGGKNDPRSAGDTGDLVLTTAGGAAGDTYSFLISATLKE